MAGNVNADPDEIRDFAKKIDSFVDDIEKARGDLLKTFEGLKWDDDVKREFADRLKDATGGFTSICDQLGEIPPELRTKADHLERFLGRM